MSADSLIFFSPAQVMQSSPFPQSTTVAENTASLNNYSEQIDFTIYSQDNSSEFENDSYPSIHQVHHNPGYLDDSDYYAAAVHPSSHLPSNHTASLACYTPHNQSPSTFTSPHGNSLIDNNPLSDFHTNINQFSPHSTPLTTSEPLLVENILNSPFSPTYINSPFFSPVCDNFQDRIIQYPRTPDFGTPYTACTPLTPYTPLISFNSDLSTSRFVPNTPSTPFIDIPLYEADSKLNNINLFGETKSELLDLVQHYSYPQYYPTVKMEVISPPIETTGNDKKPGTPNLAPGTPNSEGSTSGSASEKSVSSLSPAIDPSEHQTETNSGSQVGENPEVNTEGPRSPSPLTPSIFPEIRPRPQDDDDDSSEPAIRRSKRQRTRSISENEEENDDEEKKYTCPDCGRGFNRKFNMQTHRATHDPNRVKPFACEHPNCGSRFTRKHDLKRHVNGIHRGERVHSCTVCNKPFSRKDAWKRHVSTCGKV